MKKLLFAGLLLCCGSVFAETVPQYLANGIPAATPPLTATKGNLVVGTGSAYVAVPVGANTFVLTADSTQASGVSWVAGGSGVTTVALRNVIVGTTNMLTPTTATDNTFVGDTAGASQTTGLLNTFVGSKAGNANVTASANTFIGYKAGFVNAGAADGSNTFIGSQAGLQVNGDNGQNTFVGANAGAGPQACQQLTVVGAGSLTTSNNTYLATVVGANSAGNARSNKTALELVVLGDNAGNTLTTGTANTIIGSLADVNGGTTANLIAIGRNASGATSSVIIRPNTASSTANDFIIESGDTGWRRQIAGVVAPTNGGGGAGSIRWLGIATGSAPATAASTGAIYYDVTLQKFQVSENNGAYVNLVGGGGGGFPVLSSGAGTPVILTSASTTITGVGNTIAGGSAASAMTTGSQNVIVGDQTKTTATADSNEVVIGFQAGNTSVDGADAGVVLIGYQAGKVNTGFDNTFVGYQSGLSNTSGVNNTFLGEFSGILNIAGSRNTFLGRATGTQVNGAGDNDDTFVGHGAGATSQGSASGGNVAVGSGANVGAATAINTVAIGFNAVSPTGGTVIGASAGKASATAARFTCIGNTAGAAITSGTDDVFVGDHAGTAVDSGSRNTFVGSQAGFSTTSSFNTFIGNHAGLNVILGNDNTYIGDSAGVNAAGASDSLNTFVGGSAGSTANGSASGSNTCLGTNADVGVATAINIVAVGQGAVAPSGGTVVGQAAGKAAATAARFTCVGNTAGAAITTGADNVFVGDNAGNTITAGNENTFIGSSAGTNLNLNTVGCVFIGHQVGKQSVTTNAAFGCVAIGDSTLQNLNPNAGSNAGCCNIALGYQTARNVTTGNSNVIIGSETTGFANTGTTLTIGSNNVILGAGADVNSANTNAAILIGNLAKGSTSSVIITSGGVNSATTNDFVIESGDVGLRRVAAKVMQPTDGSGTGAWMQNPAGSKRVVTQVDATTATVANLSDLTWTLAAGRTYSFHIFLLTNSPLGGGVLLDLNGGTATATTVNISYALNDFVVPGSTTGANVTALATQVGNTAAYTQVIIDGTITVNAGGTLIPRFAQNSASGTSSVLVGSFGWIIDMP